MSIGAGVVHDLISKDDLRRAVGEDFSEEAWHKVAQGRDRIPRSELLNTVQSVIVHEQQQKRLQQQQQVPYSKDSEGGASLASPRTEAILSFLMCCDRGGKQLLAAYPALGPRKGGASSGADLREGALRHLREMPHRDCRSKLVEVEARLCMSDQRGVDVDLPQLLSDRLLSAMADLGPSGLAKAAEAFLRFAAADKGDAVRRIERRQPSTSKSAAGPASVAGEVVGGSDETKALVSFADHLIKLLANQACSSKSELRFGGCRLLGHAFQLLTGLLVTCTPSCAFAESSGGKVFDVGAREADGDEDAKCSDLVTQLGLEGSKVNSRLLAPVRHEVMVAEMKTRGNACLKKKDFSGAVAAYTTALGQGLWIEQALELVEARSGSLQEHVSAPATSVGSVVQKGEKQGTGVENGSSGQNDGPGDSGSDDDDEEDEDDEDEEKEEDENNENNDGAVEVPPNISGRFGSTQEAFEALTAKNLSEGECEGKAQKAGNNAGKAAASLSDRRAATAAANSTSSEISPAAQAAAERDLLVSHAKTAAALLANRSLANLKLGRAADALRDARLAKRCAPQWPKAHFREASALQASAQPAAAAQVLQRAITTLAGAPNSGGRGSGSDGARGDIAATERQQQTNVSPPPPWVKEFRALLAACDKQATQVAADAAANAAKGATMEKESSELATKVTQKVATEQTIESRASELPPLSAADWEYGDIMSPKAMAIFVAGFLVAGCLRSPILLTLIFSAAIATVIGAPDPRKQRARVQRREARRLARRQKAASDHTGSSSSEAAGTAAVVAGDSDESEEDDEGEFETEAGKLLSGWMAGGTGTTRGLGRRNAPPSSDVAPVSTLQHAQAKPGPPNAKISKLAKLD